MTSREKFEAWFEREYSHLESSKYTDAVPHIKDGFWLAWQASRDEEIELPKVSDDDLKDYKEECEERIRAAGFKVKGG